VPSQQLSGIEIYSVWRSLGMRGTGSNDVVIDNLFIPDAIAFSRKSAEWHPVFQIIATIAFPLIYAVYLGVAERARDIAVELAGRKSTTSYSLDLAGRMETSLRAAQLAHHWMLDTVALNAPSAETVNEVMIGRSLTAEHAIRTVELALELAGGAAFYRNGLERCFRDIQGCAVSSAPIGPQAQYAGATALGQPVINIF
jgi:alkylation response protein AidB-like acyl-CoA dehydrogenase